MTNRVKSLAEVYKNAPNKGVGLLDVTLRNITRKMNKNTGSTAGWSESKLEKVMLNKKSLETP